MAGGAEVSADKAAQRMRRKYTAVDKEDGRWTAYIVIGNQAFAIADKTAKRRAEWFARQAGIALARLVAKEDEEARK